MWQWSYISTLQAPKLLPKCSNYGLTYYSNFKECSTFSVKPQHRKSYAKIASTKNSPVENNREKNNKMLLITSNFPQLLSFFIWMNSSALSLNSWKKNNCKLFHLGKSPLNWTVSWNTFKIKNIIITNYLLSANWWQTLLLNLTSMCLKFLLTPVYCLKFY